MKTVFVRAVKQAINWKKKSENKFSLFVRRGGQSVHSYERLNWFAVQTKAMYGNWYSANRNAEVEMRHEQLSSPWSAIKEENSLTKWWQNFNQLNYSAARIVIEQSRLFVSSIHFWGGLNCQPSFGYDVNFLQIRPRESQKHGEHHNLHHYSIIYSLLIARFRPSLGMDVKCSTQVASCCAKQTASLAGAVSRDRVEVNYE